MALRAASTPLAALVAAVLALATLAWASPPGSLDDAFVVWADARIWAGGNVPSVEGSTSALDVAFKALLLKAVGPGVDPLQAAGLAGMVFLAAAVALAALLGARLGGRAGAWLAAAGVGTSVGVAEALAFRLEGGLHLLVWTAAAGLAGLARARATLLLAPLLALVRPEGLLLAPLVCAWAARDPGAGPGTRALRFGACGALLGAAVAALRLTLFGAPWPNTFFAKSSDARSQEVADGFAYLGDALAGPAGVALLLIWILGLGIVGARAGREGPHASTAAGLVGLSLLAALVLVGSGGDAYDGARLALPLGAPAWFAAAAAVRARPRVVGAVVGAALVLQIVGARPTPWPGAIPAARAAAAGVLRGPAGVEVLEEEPLAFAALARALDGETVAHRHAQRLRWFEPSLSILDLTGLTDAEIARLPHPGPNRFGRDALGLALERRVGALHLDVPFAPSVPATAAWAQRSGPNGTPGGPLELLLGPGAVGAAELSEAGYAAASFPLSSARWFNVFVRADLVERFERAGFSVRR